MALRSPARIAVSSYRRAVVIRPSDWRRQPWKNARGWTSEVLRIPDVDDYTVRVSVAEVGESGPFSTFPGYTRWSLLLEGWIELDGARMEPNRLVEVDGRRSLEAVVHAPARLLNILGKDVYVGIGATSDVRVLFDLATRETHVFDVPRGVASGVWIRW
jgi:hypothetical protein